MLNHPLLALAFRPFFLLAAVFAAVAIAVWVLVLRGVLPFQPYGGALAWHAHEMLYGFGAAVLAGFLLTAVQNWTGIPGVSRGPLLVLVVAWLAGRLFMALPLVPGGVVMLLDLLFLPLTAIFFLRSVMSAGNRRNYKLAIIVLVMFAGNLLWHFGAITGKVQWMQIGVQLFVWLIVLVMTIITGRIMPMFTANGAGVPRVENWQAVEIITVVLTIALGLLMVLPLGIGTRSPAVAWVALAAAVVHFVRWLRWRPWVTPRIPLLWSLHLSYVFLPIGFLVLFLHRYVGTVSYSNVLHWLLVGAMGNMMLAMMSRVSLGHTGRDLKPAGILTVAFLALIAAAVIRGLGVGVWQQHYMASLDAAAFFWLLGFVIFTVIYWPVLARPRADGKPG